ncbi:hypothetical protein BI364_16290 [Acidihalobacter yilgarnensis]|uniref:3-hydroxylacyl-ACP dehydratase n=1 Tax=Acidihalobacter yilgarnensis TaxID=2819280 RepID=A0A1D8ISA6_9GAMM|nr:hypothetical protein [Acidihalobacter yilgarnensis]AOU99283.1 hypothetical protein BI364_16290 [Acidihalobacter yilgarnensis]
MLIERPAIATLIPHAGDMCLIESVSSWDDTHIACHSHTHLDPANPLRRAGRLACVHGIEYAAQAAALHGALLAQRAGLSLATGRLAAVRDIDFQAARLDEIEAPLDIGAERLIATGDSFIYGFRVTVGGQPLLSGRLSVIAGAGA